MPWAVLVCDSGEDPEKALLALLDHGELRAIEGGWLLEESGADRRASAHRDRQRRYRARRKRDASASPARDARDASEPVDKYQFGGQIHSLPTASPREGVSESPIGDARDACESDARDGDARDARDSDARRWKIDPLTDDERETGRAGARAGRELLRRTPKP